MEAIKEEQPVVVDDITTALTKANVTEQILAELNTFKGLKINGIDDKKGYEEVYKARQKAKATRVLAVKICKKGREEAVAIQRKWVDKEKEIAGQIEEVESYLQSEEDRIDNEREQLKQEAIRKEQERIQGRVKRLLDLGMAFNGHSYTLENCELESNLLPQVTDESFDLFCSEVKVHADAAKAKEAEEERLRQEEQERLRLVAEEQERERVRLAEEKRRFEDHQAKIKREQEEEAERLRQLKVKMLEDREKVRGQHLIDMGLFADSWNDSYHLMGAGKISFTNVYNLEDDEWEKSLKVIEEEVATKKAELRKIREDEEEQARLRGIEEEKERQKQAEEKRIEDERIAKEQEQERINALSDKELAQVLAESVNKLAGEMEMHTMKSKAYQSKLDTAVRNLLTTASNLLK